MAKSRTQRKVKKQMKKRTVRRGKKTMMWGGVFGSANEMNAPLPDLPLVVEEEPTEEMIADLRKAREAANKAREDERKAHEKLMQTATAKGRTPARPPPKSFSEADSLYDTVAPSLPSPSLPSPSLPSPSLPSPRGIIRRNTFGRSKLTKRPGAK